MLEHSSKLQKLRAFAAQSGVLHARELPVLGIPRRYLARLCAEGALVKVARGVYQPSDAPDTIHLGLAQAAKAAPSGVVCLLSALRFHEIGAQLPHQVWMAIDRRAAKPRTTWPVIRWARFSGPALTEGIAFHDIVGVQVPIYSPAKTVADCFKYRNKIGLDVALEALREVMAGRRCAIDDLWKYAKVCRVAQVMQPYLEALS
ncbi:MAG: type IV toxin-antitoxin system AbiEi family antitoxin domain-containing protein [Planctomycetes bacterium]|nr:type IV toxin-antitoxin system AbiEi family antitoxin domain-containing protein [Planctomycetota bacterium]